MVGEKSIATNRKARHDYSILETYETGIELHGTEVKSLREGGTNLKDSFARVERGEVFLYNLHISPYSHTSDTKYNPIRTRKLLLHKKEIKKLVGQTVRKGLTLVPLRMYFKHGLAKVELALCKGKKLYDRRQELRRRTAEMEVRRVLRGKQKG